MLTEGIFRLRGWVHCSLDSVWLSAAVLADGSCEAVKPLGFCQGSK